MWEAFSYGQKPYKVGWAVWQRWAGEVDPGSSHMHTFVPGLSRK